MKKIILIISIAVFQLNISAQTSSVIKTESDSLSYAYGVGLFEQGLQQYLIQLGVLADTAIVRNTYVNRIDAALNESDRNQLERELAFKIDSISKVNQRNIDLFVEGLTDRFKAGDNRDSYYEGIAVGGQIDRMVVPFSNQIYGENSATKIDKNLILRGLTDAIRKQPLLIEGGYSLVERKMKASQEKLDAEKDAELRAQNQDIIKRGENFLNENKTRPGVVALPSGLQYKILTEGAGPTPKLDDRVRVHYRGTLMDGTVFDSSIDRGDAAVFGVGQVIPGWTEALQLMPVGSKWMLFIPSELGYGSRGAGGQIPPFSPLIFEVELLGIEQ